MRSKIKAAALVICAALLITGCKKHRITRRQTAAPFHRSLKVSSVVESTSSAVSSAEPVSSVSSKPPAESTVSSAPSQPAPAPKPTPSSSANSSYCQACSGLSPPSYYACRAHKIKTDAFEKKSQMRLFFTNNILVIHTILFVCFYIIHSAIKTIDSFGVKFSRPC